MFKVALALDHLGPSQAAFLSINNINHLSQKYPNTPFYLFFENSVLPCVKPNVACMSTNELFSFSDGIIICTNLRQLKSVVEYPNNSTVVYYMYQPETLDQNNFVENIQALSKANYLSTSSKDYATMLANYTNREVAFIPDFDIGGILKWIQSQQKKLSNNIEAATA